MSDFDVLEGRDQRVSSYATVMQDVVDKHQFFASHRAGLRSVYGCTGCDARFENRDGHPAHVALLQAHAITSLADEEIEAAKAYMAMSQPEPEYEYALRHKDTLQHYLGDGRWESEEVIRRVLSERIYPGDWTIVRRVKASEWEDVK